MIGDRSYICYQNRLPIRKTIMIKEQKNNPKAIKYVHKRPLR